MNLRTQSDIARELGVDRRTIRDLTIVWGITTHRVPLNGKAVGYTPEAVKVFRKALNAKARQTQPA